ncbi:MAG: hypothetical protein EXR58_05405 [Chloroflexi bacterium]|nr:hypothetical protein [Chloroflexota bacterium]
MNDHADPMAEDVGNIVALEHINVSIPDQTTGTLFYVVGLGLTRDPYMSVGLENMWMNAGEQQFHLPTRPSAQIIPGHIGLVVPSLDALEARLQNVAPRLSDSLFAFSHESNYLAVTCPWGNHFQCYSPSPEFDNITLGVPYVEFAVPPGAAAKIARFYAEVLGSPTRIEENDDGPVAIVSIGPRQHLMFRESERPQSAYDGHHVAIYVANFSRAYGLLCERGLVSEEMANHQFRFQNLVDPETGEAAFTLEHEVRSLRHPMFRRPLINRDPGQTQGPYLRGRDALLVG